MWPARGQGIVILTNGVSGQLLSEIQDAFRQMYGTDKAPKQRTPVAVAPGVYDKYVGRYQLAPNSFLVITREGGAFFTRLPGQQKLEILAESDRSFFAKVGDVSITFETDGAGRATGLILDQDGCTPRAPRVSDAESQRIDQAEAANAKRFKDQLPAPGSEVALRRLIEGVQVGKPNYDLMSPDLANVTRQQLQQLQATLAPLGAIQSVSFKGVGPGGADIFQVTFANGSLEYRIWLTPDGKIDRTNFRTVPPPS